MKRPIVAIRVTGAHQFLLVSCEGHDVVTDRIGDKIVHWVVKRPT